MPTSDQTSPTPSEWQFTRIVTGRVDDSEVFTDDTPLDLIKGQPGWEALHLWGWDEVPAVPNDGTEPAQDAALMFPEIGGSRVQVVRRSLSAAERAGGADAVGFHASKTVDFIVVVSGAMTLALPSGEAKLLKPGHIVVQNGTEHSWTPEGDEPCVFFAITVGAPSMTKTEH